jgi:hypothetical protein
MTLPFLKDLVLKFRTDNGPFRADNSQDTQNPPEVVLQFLIIRALGEIQAIPSSLKSLTLDHLLPVPHGYLGSPAVLRLLSTLTHFAINTTSRCALFETADPEMTPPLFTQAAFSSSLVSLQLHHACVRSAELIFPISNVHLPRLKYLSFQRVLFSKRGEVEQFIARHGGTLVQLKLFLCPMALSTRSTFSRPPQNFRRWAQVWDHFDRDLKVLKDLVVSDGHDSNGAEDVGSGKYVDNTSRCNVVDLEKEDIATDDTALEHFRKSVESRWQRL